MVLYLHSKPPSRSIHDQSKPPPNTCSSLLFGLTHQPYLIYREGVCVMMVVQEGETNVADQRWIEFELWKKFKIHLIRRTLKDVIARGKLDKDEGYAGDFVMYATPPHIALTTIDDVAALPS